MAHLAQKKYAKRRRNCGRKSIFTSDPEAKKYVLKRLALCWTPEQIAGRAKLENQPFSLSYVTIYRAIDAGVLAKNLKKIMCFKWKHKKCKTDDQRGKIQGTTSIHASLAGANERSELEHWESDTVFGRRKTGCLGTYVERKTGILVAFYLSDRQDDKFNLATEKTFATLPDALKKSFPVDNGSEFSHRQKMAEKTGMDVYFCASYSPWQRGLNENTNGLFRQFFSKGSSFENISPDFLQAIVKLINHRPRKRFGFRSPFEMLQSSLSECCT